MEQFFAKTCEMTKQMAKNVPKCQKPLSWPAEIRIGIIFKNIHKLVCLSDFFRKKGFEPFYQNCLLHFVFLYINFCNIRVKSITLVKFRQYFNRMEGEMSKTDRVFPLEFICLFDAAR